MGEFQRREAAENSGIPARRVQFYTDVGVIRLDEQHTGRGRERAYSRQNLFELLVVKELADQKIELAQIRRIVSELPQKLGVDFLNLDSIAKSKGGAYLYVYPDGKISYDKQKDPDTLRRSDIVKIEMRNYASAVVVNLSLLADRVLKG
ncbi:MAG: MerR family transcriptional regulator [candidate division Zixibacteria bacterium]|nr:MerR family transcriptional regulator [candidate division Zixibacteria bacterium]